MKNAQVSRMNKDTVPWYFCIKQKLVVGAMINGFKERYKPKHFDVLILYFYETCPTKMFKMSLPCHNPPKISFSDTASCGKEILSVLNATL